MDTHVQESKPKAKDTYWQYVRGFCIICFVLIHCKNGIGYKDDHINSWNYDYWLIVRQVINLPVAIFVFLSGYFTKIELVKRLDYI